MRRRLSKEENIVYNRENDSDNFRVHDRIAREIGLLQGRLSEVFPDAFSESDHEK